MELLLASAFPSIAAVIIYAMKLHSKKPKPFVHEHIWGPWIEYDEHIKTYHTGAKDKLLEFRRQCDDCKDVEIKQYSISKAKWVEGLW